MSASWGFRGAGTAPVTSLCTPIPCSFPSTSSPPRFVTLGSGRRVERKTLPGMGRAHTALPVVQTDGHLAVSPEHKFARVRQAPAAFAPRSLGLGCSGPRLHICPLPSSAIAPRPGFSSWSWPRALVTRRLWADYEIEVLGLPETLRAVVCGEEGPQAPMGPSCRPLSCPQE